MDHSDAGGYSSAPPPLGNVGCFKGVMLCNRPPDDLSRAGGGEAGRPPPPFKSTVAAAEREQVGLPPAKDSGRPEHPGGVKTRGPSAALRRHCQWIRELQEQVRADQQQAEASEQLQQERVQRMQEAFRRQREAVRQIKKDRDVGSIPREEIEAILGGKGGGGRPRRAAQKPLWALTEEEREGVEEEEADDLIRFAEGIDFDQYIHDFEFRQGLEVLQDRARSLKRDQDAFKDSLLREFEARDDEGSPDLDAGTEAGCSDRTTSRRFGPASAAGDRPDWDASTACSDDRHAVDRDARAAADRILEANPQLRAVHSKGSVKKLIERASEQGSVYSGSM